mgnify:CR=1 FL=1
MKNYQALHYNQYFIMNDANTTTSCTRRACFAPPEDIPGCAYPQRWFYDPEAGYAVRLSRNAHGDAIGRRCMADLKKTERVQERSASNVSLDKPRAGSDGDDLGGMDVADTSVNIEQLIADADSLQHLMAILAQLTEDDRALIDLLCRKAKKADIAERFQITVDGVRYRELQLRKRLLKNPDFQKMFRNV